MVNKQRLGGRRALVCAAASQLAWIAPTQAGNVDFGNGTQLDYAVIATYSAAMRMEQADDALLANINGDDGNRNFDQHALTNNRLAVLGEVKLERNRMGVFLRGSAFYDDAYQGGNDNDSPGTVNKNGAHDEFSDDAEEYLGARARLLDAYAYIGLPVGSTDLELRAGNQVISWGESLFFPNMSGAQSPADSTKSNVPGAEVKDILLPSGTFYAQWGLTQRLSVGAYYQWEYESTELTPIDGYFSTSDVVGPGAEFLIVPQLAPFGLDHVPRGPDLTPDDDGQWGAAAKYQITDSTEIGLYRIRYHDKAPIGVVTNSMMLPGVPIPLPSSYQVLYVDDIDMTSLAVSTDLFGAAVGAELSLREEAGVTVAIGGSPAATRGDVWQANVNFTKLILPTAFWDTLTLLGEVSGLKVENVDAIEVVGQSGTSTYDDTGEASEAYAYQLLAQLGYRQVFAGWDVTFSAIHANLFQGRSPVGGGLASLTSEGDLRYTGGVAFKYLSNLELALAYNAYHGDPATHPLADRDYLSFSAKYAF